MRFLVPLALLPLPAFAETLPLDARVEAALITGNGGVVTYGADVTVPKGRHMLTLRLPLDARADEAAITDIRLPDGLTLVAQTFARTRVAPADRVLTDRQTAARQARIAAQEALGRHQAETAAIEASVRAAGLQVTLAEAAAKAGLSTGSSAPSAEDLASVATQIAAMTVAAESERARLQLQLKMLQPETARLELALRQARAREDAAIAEAVQPSGLLTLTVDADTGAAGRVAIDNREPVNWRPAYAFDLMRDGAQGTMQIHRQAIVSYAAHSYGEFVEPLYQWSDISLTLTTADLSARTDAAIPLPRPMRLIDKPSASRVSGGYAKSSALDVTGAPMPEPLIEMRAEDAAARGVSHSGQTVVFALGDGQTLDRYSDSATFDIDTVSIPVPLYAMANAATDSHAYLYADLENTSPGIILSGRGLLRVNDAVVGTISLPTLLPGQQEPLGLGPLYGLRIDRSTLSVQEGEGGLISARTDLEQRYRTVATSALDHAIDLHLLDVVPTSENEDLRIALTTRPTPATESRDGKRGVIEWVLPMAPGAEQTVEFGYRMQWPGDKLPMPN